MQLAVYTGCLLRLLPIVRFLVADTSMAPALRPGDRLLVVRWLTARSGDVIVFRDPEAHSTFLIKRVGEITPGGDVLARGDSPNVSRDSRHFGPVPRSLVIGRAVYRYLPRERRGLLRGRGVG
jgi:nickel-type superoxide dismutase maturation protease